MHTNDYIKKFSVKIKFHGFQGTGVLIRSNNDYYIITAKHNFKENTEETHVDVKIEPLEKNINDIEISVENENNIFGVDKIIFFKKSLDLIIFSIKNISSLKNIDSIKIFKGKHYNNDYFLYGYPNDKSGRPLSLLYSEEINNNEFRLTGSRNIRGKFLTGLSGSGLFIKTNNIYYLVGILTKEESGLFFYEAVNISSLEDEITLISSMQYEYKNYDKNQEKSFKDGKNLFNIGLFNDSANIFHEIVSGNSNDFRSYFYYCIAKLSSVENISNMYIKDIKYIYSYIDILNDTIYKKISTFLWLIVFYEYSQPNSKTLNLENKVDKKIDYVMNTPLSQEEKKFFYKIPILTEKARVLLSFRPEFN